MWIITNDLMDSGKKVGTASRNYDEANTGLLKHRFRLLDDDAEIYYVGLSDDCASQHAFAPLYDFGQKATLTARKSTTSRAACGDNSDRDNYRKRKQ